MPLVTANDHLLPPPLPTDRKADDFIGSLEQYKGGEGGSDGQAL